MGLLLGAVVVPFLTAILANAFVSGNHAGEQVAIALYASVGMFMAATWFVFFLTLERRQHLAHESVAPGVWRSARYRAVGRLGRIRRSRCAWSAGTSPRRTDPLLRPPCLLRPIERGPAAQTGLAAICHAPRIIRLRDIGGVMDTELVNQVIEVAQRVVASGAISANGHGQVSLRVPGAEEVYFTGGPSLRNHPPSAVVRLGLDGTLREGELPPIQGAVVAIAMHMAMYADHSDIGCVIHTHSPYATAYAVAHRPIGCWVEALAMFGMASGVPVAGYGPRGSDEAVANIRAAITPGIPAVLLANHGVLVFHRSPDLAIITGGIIEEAAQAGINAGSLGGPVEIPEWLAQVLAHS